MTKKRKRKAAPRKRSRHLSEGLSRRVGRKVRSRRRAKKGLLSELFSASTATSTAKNMAAAAGGGYAYGIVSPLVSSNIENPLAQNAVKLGLSFVTSAVLKMPNLSAGMAGAWGYELANKMTGLSEMNEADFVDEDSLEEYPEFMDEAGNPVYLADDGSYVYLNEMNEMNEDDMMDEAPTYLAEPVYLADSMYPDYVNVSNY